jgi:hypothetical protein
VLREFDGEFGTPCGLIGPAEEICRTILGHGPLAVTIAILGLEWMSQGHYLGSVKDNQDLDPQFRSLLKHHWIEEAQHARLDGLVLKSLAERSSPQDIATAIQEYLQIGSFLDAGLNQQAGLDLESLERAIAAKSGPHRTRWTESLTRSTTHRLSRRSARSLLTEHRRSHGATATHRIFWTR